METEQIIVNLNKSQKAALLKLAALKTASSGRRVSMSDLVRTAIELILTAQIDTAPDDGKTQAIKFIPIPVVKQAIERAHLNSGKSVADILNEAVAEVFQLEMSL